MAQRSSSRSAASTPEEETPDEEATETTEEETAEDDEAATEEGADDAPAEAVASDTPLAEVDVADIGTDKLEGENDPVIQAGETWVTLAEHEGVPDWAVGNIAQVISAPTVTTVDEDTGASTTVNPPNGVYEVRERSQGPTFFLPRDAFEEVHSHGRPLTFA